MMNLTIKKRKAKGFSLIEILVTAIILSVGMVGASKFQGSIIQKSTLSHQQVEAVNIAKSLIEPTIHFSTSKQYEDFLALGAGESNVDGTIDTYKGQWSIAKTDNSRAANVTLSVGWGENESIYLSTIVSNTTPSMIVQTTHAPTRDPAIDPVFKPIIFPAVNPTNPANSENICRCNGGTAVAFNDIPKNQPGQDSNFVRVSGDGGMMGKWYDNDGDGNDDDESDSDERAIRGASEECNLCCDSANALGQAEKAEKYYAQLEAMFMKKVRFGGDQVIGNNGFDPRYLIKGYQIHKLDDDIKKYLGKASSYDWGADDDSDDSDASAYTFTAACGIDYDPAPAPTVAVPSPKPKPRSTRCIYYRNN